jgi:hypothetical protein
MDDINKRWEDAIAKAKILLVQYNELDKTHEKYTFRSVIDALEAYLYLADVYKRESIAVLHRLEAMTLDIEAWRDRIPIGPGRRKMGHDFI